MMMEREVNCSHNRFQNICTWTKTQVKASPRRKPHEWNFDSNHLPGRYHVLPPKPPKEKAPNPKITSVSRQTLPSSLNRTP